MPFEDNMFKHPVFNKQFKMFTPAVGKIHRQRLLEIREKLDQYPWLPDDNFTIAPIPAKEASFGVAEKVLGIIGINERLLDKGADERLAMSTILHERTHLQVGSEVRQSILKEHGELDGFFHNVILKDWEEGKIDLDHDRAYLGGGNWKSLYENWVSWYNFSISEAEKMVGNYFHLLRKEELRYVGSGLDHINPDYVDLWPEMMGKGERPLHEIYADNPKQFVKILLTGYDLGDETQVMYRQLLSGKHKINLFDLEEGHANFIGSGLSGVSLEETNLICRQDDDKLQMAKKIMAKGVDPKEALEQVRSGNDLIAFYSKHGVIN